MKIVVVGTGLIGSILVSRLTEHRHDAVTASRASGVDTLTGDGLARVLEGARLSSTCRPPVVQAPFQHRTFSRPPPATCWPPKRPPASDITSCCPPSVPAA